MGVIYIKTFELQPLRIHSDWTIKYNTFSEYDPESDNPEYAAELCEDLLQLENKNLLIDLGWYPEFDISGSYTLRLVDITNENPFDFPLEQFKSKSKNEIICRIEHWTNYDFFKMYLR